MPTIQVRKIAKELSLSPGTISKVIRGHKGEVSYETVKRVLNHCLGNGHITRNNMNQILFKFNEKTSSSQLFVVSCRRGVEVYDAAFAGICEEMQNDGLFASFYVVGEKDGLNIFPFDKTSSAIIMGRVSETVLNRFIENQVPVVLLDNMIPETPTSSVNSNNLQGVSDSVSYLAKLGHKRIAFACLHQDNPNMTRTFHQRQTGYVAGLVSSGLPYDENLCIIEYSDKNGSSLYNPSKCTGYIERIAKRFLEIDELPTAIVAVNDFVASTLRGFLAREGIKTPEDVSIIGYDGLHRLNSVHDYKPVSTRVVDWAKMGRESVTLAINLSIAPDEGCKNIEIPTVFEDMGTVSSPR